MLRNLLRYEFKSSARIFSVVYLAILVLSVSSGILNRISDDQRNTYINEPVSTIGSALMVVTALFFFAAVVITTVVNIRRFYQGVFQDEGYLLHTLPVQQWQILASKLIPAVVWTIATMAVMGVCLMLGMVLGNTLTIKELWEAIGYSFDNLTRNGEWAALFLTLVLGFVQLIASILQVYASIALGQIFFSRHKIAGAVAVWFGLNTLQAWMSVVMGENSYNLILNYVIASYYEPDNAPIFLLMTGISAVWSVVFWAVTQWVLTRKLNLE